MNEINTKSEFLRRSTLGLLGNCMPLWESVREARNAGYHGPVMLRYREASSLFMRPHVPLDEVDALIDSLAPQGALRELFYLSWADPKIPRTLNAEVWRAPGGLYLNYGTSQINLRDDLTQNGRHVQGSAATAILRWACCPNSFDDIEELLDRYPDHVIELTAYASFLGNLPGRNTIVWEVRHY